MCSFVTFGLSLLSLVQYGETGDHWKSPVSCSVRNLTGVDCVLHNLYMTVAMQRGPDGVAVKVYSLFHVQQD